MTTHRLNLTISFGGIKALVTGTVLSSEEEVRQEAQSQPSLLNGNGDIRYNDLGQRLATANQVYYLKANGLGDETTTAQDAFNLIKDHKAEREMYKVKAEEVPTYSSRTETPLSIPIENPEPLPWEQTEIPMPKKRGRPKKV